MSFMDSVKTVFGKYATFSGRALRSEFWWYVLFIFYRPNCAGNGRPHDLWPFRADEHELNRHAGRHEL